jgi:hypothetical protein
MIVFQVAKGVRDHFWSRAPEWCLAPIMALSGWRLLGDDTIFASSKIYGELARAGPQVMWGMMALGVGAFWLVALILNGTFAWFSRWSRWIRSLAAFAAAGVWLFFAYAIWRVYPQGAGVINNGGLGIMAMIVSLVTARDVGRGDKADKDAATRKS